MAQNHSEARELGRRIFSAREATGCRQEDLATAIGVATMTISRYERGSMVPSALVLGQIAEALGVTADWLLGRG